MAAKAFQVRASVSKWLEAAIVLDQTVTPADRIAHQAIQGQQPNEWHISWDGEQDGMLDQGFSRLLQITRSRADGDENAFEIEAALLIEALGLNRPGAGVSIPVYDWPDNGTTAIPGSITIRRLANAGWVQLPDPGQRPNDIRAALTLQVDYSA